MTISKPMKTGWTPRTGRTVFATALLATTIMLHGCAGASAGDFCLLYKPVYTSEKDTEETRRQADGNNAVWLALCQR